MASGLLQAQEKLGDFQIGTSRRQVEPKGSSFLRLKKNAAGEVTAMQTSITRFAAKMNGEPVIVDLIGAVHIGDQRYYEQLNDEFENYDVVLYELVAPPEKRIPTQALREQNSKNLLTTIRKIAQILFEFEMQLDGVDYTADNFVHADLSPQELIQTIKARGDNAVSLFLSLMSDMIRQKNLRDQQLAFAKEPEAKAPQIDLLAVVQDPNGPAKVKQILAQQLVSSVTQTTAPNSTMNQILVVDRNKAALKVMIQQLRKGHRKIGIFYGAAHMPDFEQRLLRMKMKKSDERWLTAWNLRAINRSRVEHIAKFLAIIDLIQQQY